MTRRIVLLTLLSLILTGCKLGEPVSAEAIEAVAETCKEQGKEVEVFQNSQQLRIRCK